MSAGNITLSKNITFDFVFYKPKKIYKSKNTFKGFKAFHSVWNTLTSMIEFKTAVLRGDSSTWRWRRICFRALCTILETDSLWIGTVADGSVSFDKAEVISVFSAEITHCPH